MIWRGRDSSVSIVTRPRAERIVRFPLGARHSVQSRSGVNPPYCSVGPEWVPFRSLQRPGREAAHSPQVYTPRLWMRGAIPSLTVNNFMAWCLFRWADSFFCLMICNYCFYEESGSKYVLMYMEIILFLPFCRFYTSQGAQTASYMLTTPALYCEERSGFKPQLAYRFYSLTPDKCCGSTSDYVATASFHILFSSLFLNHWFCDATEPMKSLINQLTHTLMCINLQ